MLINDILATGYIENFGPQGLEPLKQRLRNAAVFELKEDFAAAAEELALNYTTIANAIPHCRLPFRETWFEVAQNSRPRYSTAAIHIPEVQGVPHRVGFFMSAADAKLAEFKVHLFWNMKSDHQHIGAGWLAMNFNPNLEIELIEEEKRRKLIFGDIGAAPQWEAASPETKARLNSMIRPTVPDYPIDLGEIGEYGAQALWEISAADWAGEGVFVLGTLALLNTLNAVDRTTIDNTKLNRARAKNGKPPLVNHYELSISKRLKSRIYESDSFGHRNLRHHMVRGHFKVRKSGIFFWKPYMRGDKNLGKIDKTYVLTE